MLSSGYLQVYLQHLQALLSLSTFTALWLTILEFMDKFLHADYSGQLVSLPNLTSPSVPCMAGDEVISLELSSPCRLKAFRSC